MRINIGSDHAGYSLKEELKPYLRDLGHEVVDQGTHTAEVSVDYPDFALPVARGVADGQFDCGIVICGTGIGISIAANKVRGVRAALCTNAYMARMSRLHNDANVLALGARVIGGGLARDIVDAFLAVAFEGGRHQGRVDKISAIRDA